MTDKGFKPHRRDTMLTLISLFQLLLLSLSRDYQPTQRYEILPMGKTGRQKQEENAFMLCPQANSSYLQFIMTCSEELVHRHERAPTSGAKGRGEKQGGKKTVRAHAGAKRVPAPANTVPLSELVNTLCKWAPDADANCWSGSVVEDV